jgi:predicted nucleic acid-binding protein
MADVCIDASVAAKWVLVESDTRIANALLQALLAADDRLVVPMHLPAEITSAIYKRLRAGLITAREASASLAQFSVLPLRARHPAGITQRALDIAAGFDAKYPYDAFYLALGDLLGCDVWTADRTLYAAAHASFARLHLLSDFRAGEG